MTELLTNDKTALSFSFPNVNDAFPSLKFGDFAVLYGHPFCKILGFLLSVRCQLPRKADGFNSTAIYVDGGNTFDPYVISSIALDYNLDPRSTLKRIFVSRAFTAYQLSSLIVETLENALKRYRSKLVVISDIMSLFLDRDVTTKETIYIFNNAVTYLSELAAQRKIIIVVSCFSQANSERRLHLEETLFEKANVIIRIKELKGKLQLIFEKHQLGKSFSIDILQKPLNTLEEFAEA